MLAALVVGVPMSAYGNLTGSTPWTVAGAIAVIVLSGTGTVAASLLRSREAALTDRQLTVEA